MQDNLDRLIDGALSGYSNVEPLAGLEDRVLNRVRVEGARRRRRMWILGVLAAPALVALIIAIPWRRPPAVAEAPAPTARLHAVAPAVVAPTPAPVRKIARRHRTEQTPARRVLPKREVFPTPTPLTKEERLLVQLAASHPEALVMRPMEQIEIKPIEIAPLEIGGGE